MDRYELLVHVTAPGTVRDDYRYRAIAQAISDFEPATMMRLGLHDVPDWEEADEQIPINAPPTGSSTPTTSVITQTPIARAPTEHPSTTRMSVVDSARPSEHWWITKAGHRDLSERNPTLKTNPPYRNPFHGLNRQAPTYIQLGQTSDIGRPRTAPSASSPRLQVPHTDRVHRKRALSDSSSIGSLLSAISDSQPLRLATPSSTIGVSFTEHVRSSKSNKRVEEHFINSSNRVIQSTIHPPKRRRVITGESDKRTSGMNVGPSSLQAPGEPFFLPNSSMDWTSSSAPSTSALLTGSLASTVSPSQPILPTSFLATAMQRRLAVDLTSPSVQIVCSPGTLRERVSPSPVKPSNTVRREVFGPAFGERMKSHEWSDSARTPAILLPPFEINCPPPLTSSNLFSTHITLQLTAMTDRLPLANYFRPDLVLRDVKVLERGYWQLELTIANEGEVLKARQSPKKAELLNLRRKRLNGDRVIERLEQWEKSRHPEGHLQSADLKCSPQRRSLWRETEFLHFWHNMTAFIQAGKAGWGVRVVKEVTNSGLSDPNNECLDLTLKVFTWGEVIGHTWLALWVLSDKLSSYVPMKWIAADEMAVVRMTGDRYRQGKLGAWSRKGPAGEKGRWGVADRLDG